MEIGFIYGALSDPLEKQANEQGFTLGDKREHLETLSRAMVVCRINGLCTDSQYDAMCKNYVREINEGYKPTLYKIVRYDHSEFDGHKNTMIQPCWS